jgi:hypothetical protein
MWKLEEKRDKRAKEEGEGDRNYKGKLEACI